MSNRYEKMFSQPLSDRAFVVRVQIDVGLPDIERRLTETLGNIFRQYSYLEGGATEEEASISSDAFHLVVQDATIFKHLSYERIDGIFWHRSERRARPAFMTEKEFLTICAVLFQANWVVGLGGTGASDKKKVDGYRVANENGNTPYAVVRKEALWKLRMVFEVYQPASRQADARGVYHIKLNDMKRGRAPNVAAGGEGDEDLLVMKSPLARNRKKSGPGASSGSFRSKGSPFRQKSTTHGKGNLGSPEGESFTESRQKQRSMTRFGFRMGGKSRRRDISSMIVDIGAEPEEDSDDPGDALRNENYEALFGGGKSGEFATTPEDGEEGGGGAGGSEGARKVKGWGRGHRRNRRCERKAPCDGATVFATVLPL